MILLPNLNKIRRIKSYNNMKKLIIVFKTLNKELFAIFAENLVISLQNALTEKNQLIINKKVKLKSYVIYVNNQDIQHPNVRPKTVSINRKVKLKLYAIYVNNQDIQHPNVQLKTGSFKIKDAQDITQLIQAMHKKI